MVKAAPWFIAGYWMEPVDGNAYAIVLFDTEEHTRATAPPEGASPAPGVTVVRSEFREVLAHALGQPCLGTTMANTSAS